MFHTKDELGLFFCVVFCFLVLLVHAVRFFVGFKQGYLDHPFDKGRILEDKKYFLLMFCYLVVNLVALGGFAFFLRSLILYNQK